MNYGLPTSAEIQGVTYEINSDYRAILDILEAFEDPALDNEEKAIVALTIFYPDFSTMPQKHYKDALDFCMLFIKGGQEEEQKQGPRLMSWVQDFQIIVAPINRVSGTEIRSVQYMHWYTFLSAFYEIGECTFAQVVAIRNKLKTGKKLEKWEREWYRRNKHLVDFKTKYTDAETDLIKAWT